MLARKTLVISIFMALAIGVLPGSAAMASGGGTWTVAGGGAVNYTATQEGSGFAFTLPGNRKLTCASTTWSGSMSNNGTSTIATPASSGCTIEIGVGGEKLPATIEWRTCKFSVTLTGQTGGGAWQTDTFLQCGAGDQVRIHVYANHAEHTAGIHLCEYRIAPQGPIANVEVVNATATTVRLIFSASPLAYTKQTGPIGTCGGASGTLAMTGSLLATGAGGVGVQVH